MVYSPVHLHLGFASYLLFPHLCYLCLHTSSPPPPFLFFFFLHREFEIFSGCLINSTFSNCRHTHSCALQAARRCKETEQEHQGGGRSSGQGHLQPNGKGAGEWQWAVPDTISPLYFSSSFLFFSLLLLNPRAHLVTTRSSLSKWWVNICISNKDVALF